MSADRFGSPGPYPGSSQPYPTSPRFGRKWLLTCDLIVAGTGFEPVTSGL
jgi:hypothetical protein